MTVFRFLCKTDYKKVKWAEQIAMESPKISHKIKEFQSDTRTQRTWNLIFAGITTIVQS